MADPFTWVAIGASVLSAGASIAGGFQQAAALDAQADAQRVNAKYAELRRVQGAALRRSELNRVLGAIDVTRAGRGVGLDSPTGMAIRKGQRADSKFARNMEEMTHRLDAMRSTQAANAASSAAPWAIFSGFANALPAIASAASGAAGLGGSQPKPTSGYTSYQTGTTSYGSTFGGTRF